MSQLKEKISLESILESLGGAPTQAAAPAPRAVSAPPTKPGAAAPVTAPAAAATPSPASATSAPAVPKGHGGSAVTTTAVEAAWTAAVEKFAQERPMEADTIRALEFRASKADQIEVLVPKALEKKIHYLRSPRNLEVLEKALTEKLGVKLQLVYLVGDGSKAEKQTVPTPASSAAPGKPAPPPPNMSQEAFLADPVIQNALKIFEAKIVAPANK